MPGVLPTCSPSLLPQGLLSWLSSEAIEAISYMRISTVKRYDVEQCSWQMVSSHWGGRRGSCVVAVGNYLYVCGGTIDDNCFAEAERFDTVEKEWEEIANMQQNRGDAFGVATVGKIFVAGGHVEHRQLCLQICEVFNILTNEWQLMGILTVERPCGCMV